MEFVLQELFGELKRFHGAGWEIVLRPLGFAWEVTVINDEVVKGGSTIVSSNPITALRAAASRIDELTAISN